MSTELPVLKSTDFASDQDIRWCPGCGDYSILALMKSMLPSLGVPRETVLDDFMASNGRWSMQGVSADWALRATVHADYLQCAFDEIDKRWGSMHAYLEGPFGLDQQARERLIARLLVRR